MSELNRAIKPWLLANSFKEIDVIPEDATEYDWDYQYHNGEYYIYFDEGRTEVKACYDDSTIHELWDATSEQVISYFTEHGNIPEQETKQVDIPLAQQMWDYLLSIGFEVIDNNDSRLGCQAGWKYNIAKGNLCAYHASLTGKFIFLLDKNVNLNAVTDDELNIRSVADLQTWLQDNGYLDAAPTSVSDAAKPENEACFVPTPLIENVDKYIIDNKKITKDILHILKHNGFLYCSWHDDNGFIELRLVANDCTYLGSINLDMYSNALAVVEAFMGKLEPVPKFMPKHDVIDALLHSPKSRQYYIKVAVTDGYEYVVFNEGNLQRKIDYLKTALADDGTYVNSNGAAGIVDAGATGFANNLN